MFNWEKLKENNTLEDFYNILCRNKPHRNSKSFKEWNYLESITYEELLSENENIQICNEIIDKIIVFLKKQKKDVLKNTNNIKIDKKDLIIFLDYLLEHIEKCYYKECKQSIKRFLERNDIQYE